MTDQEPLFTVPEVAAELPADVWLLTGDCIELMAELGEASVDAVVCDPPYALGFMGKSWDSFDVPGAILGSPKAGATGIAHSHGYLYNEPTAFQAWCLAWATEAFRVLKPGGHLVAFGGTRTYHRLGCAVEDAGFEIRDSIHWLYGSGFPKSMDVGKAIDKAAGAERTEVVGIKPGHEDFVDRTDAHAAGGRSDGWERPWRDDQAQVDRSHQVMAPVTAEAARWEGWGTALKPAHEPIVLARKPLVGTVAKNVLLHGTGGINIDGCRVGYQDAADQASATPQGRATSKASGAQAATPDAGRGIERVEYEHDPETRGRWPANVVFTHSAGCEQAGTKIERGHAGYPNGPGGNGFHGGIGRDADGSRVEPHELIPDVEVVAYRCVDGCPVAELDAQSGERKAGGKVRGTEPSKTGESGIFGVYQRVENIPYDDKGGASRFFYVAKASRSERNAGLGGIPPTETRRYGDRSQGPLPQQTGQSVVVESNNHPTVKPVALMRYLVRLVTPPGGLVLDPFLGSGTTGIAAVLERHPFIGIDKSADYISIAKARIAFANQQKGRA